MKWLFGVIFVLACNAIPGFAYTCDDVQFVLYAGNIQSYTVTYLSAANVSSAQLVDAPITAYSNGFKQAYIPEPGLSIINAYLTAGDANVIHVKWDECSVRVYAESVECVPRIGQCVSDFMYALSTAKGIPSEAIRLVGFSLGAHAMGFAAQAHQQQYNSNFSQIIGLDPAGPMYQNAPKSYRLSDDDAPSVVAIHTDDWVFGYGGSIGTVDFFCNGGTAVQPGCAPEDIIYTVCSHLRSGLYFAESLVTGNFYARKCSSGLSYKLKMCEMNDMQPMGQDVALSARGSYYLTTNSQPLYARNGVV